MQDEVDRKRETLDNLLYEKSHYERSIRECINLDTTYQNIDLASVSEFLSSAPENLKVTDRSKSHKLMLNRLAYELQERKRYCVSRSSISSTHFASSGCA